MPPPSSLAPLEVKVVSTYVGGVVGVVRGGGEGVEGVEKPVDPLRARGWGGGVNGQGSTGRGHPPGHRWKAGVQGEGVNVGTRKCDQPQVVHVRQQHMRWSGGGECRG